MKGEISICDEFFESPIEFETGIGFFDLDIFVSKEHNLDKFLQDKATFIKLIDRKLHNDDLTGFHDDLDVERILNTPNMIRSERKIRAIIVNANRYIEIIKE